MPEVCLITGAGSGFGQLGALSLAKAGHIVYAGLHHSRQSTGAAGDPNPIHNIVCDITNTESIDACIKQIMSEQGRLDCVVHNAGHMGMVRISIGKRII